MKLKSNKNCRLDSFLVSELNISRNQIENFIKKIGVKINDKEIKKCGYKLSAHDIVEFELQDGSSKKEFDVKSYEIFDKITIIYEDRDILVLNKPPFITVHDAPSVKEPTLVDWLKYKGFSLSTISGDIRHGIVHRLDKETSGVIVVAKNNDSHLTLSAQLQDKSMGRYYLALIKPPLKENIVVDRAIGRNPKNRIKMAIIDSARKAKSKFAKLILSNDEKIELIAAKLYTGRTHQIRIHLNSLSRAILGDYLYGFKKNEGKINRVMLHAYLLYLKHPTNGKDMLFQADLRDDFSKILYEKFSTRDIDASIDKDYIISVFNTF